VEKGIHDFSVFGQKTLAHVRVVEISFDVLPRYSRSSFPSRQSELIIVLVVNPPLLRVMPELPGIENRWLL